MADDLNQPVADYWLAHYVRREMCSLCGQSGIIDTRSTAITQTGLRCGAIHFCICPNGQLMRNRGGCDARTWQEWQWLKSQEMSPEGVFRFETKDDRL